MKIPIQLRSPNFRFFLVTKNKKTPFERRWNYEKNYMFFEKKLEAHIFNGGNVGVCTGPGNLIVIDFDCMKYQQEKVRLLPRTFTVKTAVKGMLHKYYILKGEMIKKIGIGLDPRVCDIQANKSGVICPPSRIDRRFYSVVDDVPIAEITKEELSKIFNINTFKEPVYRERDGETFPEKIRESVDLLKKLGVGRKSERHFRCPFHAMSGNGNLWVGDDGSIHCFHCGFHANSAKEFERRWNELTLKEVKV